VTPQQRASVLSAVRSALDSTGLSNVAIQADESSWTTNFDSDAPTWLPSAASSNSVSVISHHQYGFADDSTAAQMGNLGRQLSGGKDMWFTEICCFGAADSSRAGDPSAPLTYKGGFEYVCIPFLYILFLNIR
jgi:O-glycosyl hydrolase